MSTSFSLDVEQWVQRAKDRADAAFQATALDAVNTVKAHTPVRTGFLRANWTVVKNNDEVPLPSRVQHPEEVIAKLRVGDRLLVVNPVVYAQRVENGFVGSDAKGRHYDQRGAHMMQLTIEQLPEIARRATARIMSGGDPLKPPVDPDATA